MNAKFIEKGSMQVKMWEKMKIADRTRQEDLFKYLFQELLQN